MLNKNFNTWLSTVVESTRRGGSLMPQKPCFILPGKHIYAGLEDSRRTCKISVLSKEKSVHEKIMKAAYDKLTNETVLGRAPSPMLIA